MDNINVLCDISVKDFTSMSYLYSSKPKKSNRNRKLDLGLMFVAEGKVSIASNNKNLELQAGDGVFMPLNLLYRYSRPKPGKVFILNFTAYNSSVLTDIIRFHIEPKYIISYLDSFKSIYFSNNGSKRPALLSIFYSILQIILRSGETTRHPALKKAINYIENNLNNPLLNSAEIAAAVGYSEGHLRRLFKGTCNASPVQYINDLRIDTAKNLLLSTELSIKEISVNCGFTSPFYFSKIFKTKSGLSPTKYKEENKIII